MEDDAENYGANHGHGQNAAIGQVGIQHYDSEHDACKPPGTVDQSLANKAIGDAAGHSWISADQAFVVQLKVGKLVVGCP